jgi:hypothetical protein
MFNGMHDIPAKNAPLKYIAIVRYLFGLVHLNLKAEADDSTSIYIIPDSTCPCVNLIHMYACRTLYSSG